MEFAGKFCSLVEILQHKFIAASENICSFYSNIAAFIQILQLIIMAALKNFACNAITSWVVVVL